MDFFFRKIVRDKGQALTKLMTDIQEFAKGDEGNGALQAERELLATALEDVQGIVATMVGSPDRLGRGRHATSTRSARTPPGCCWPAATWSSPGCCCGRPRSRWRRWTPAPAGRDEAFYEGKVAAAQFFAAQVLPLLTAAARDRRERRQRPDGRPRGRLLAAPARRVPRSGRRSGRIHDHGTRHFGRVSRRRYVRVCVPYVGRPIGWWAVCRAVAGVRPLPAAVIRRSAHTAPSRLLTNPGGTMGIGVSIFLIARRRHPCLRRQLRRVRPGHQRRRLHPDDRRRDRPDHDRVHLGPAQPHPRRGDVVEERRVYDDRI